ncbi:MAG: amidohydrolase family protein [Betaproteobacteria bacterium]|nr:amidohydrolase family protein [Betaproteobacteria bacterium]
MDDDGDGRISRDEWRRLPQAFNRVDRNGDGYATAEELDAFLKMRFSDGSAPRRDGNRPGGEGSAPPLGAKSAGYEIIDTHVHLGGAPKQRDFDAAMEEALSKLPERHIAIAVLLPLPQHGRNPNKYDHWELRRVVRSDRFRVAGGSGILGKMLYSAANVSENEKEEFRAAAEAMAKTGIVAFGEIGLYHLATPRAGNVFGFTPLDHPLLDVLGEVAAKYGLPIDVHLDVVPEDMDLPKQLQGAGNPGRLRANLEGFERFLTRNRRTKIVWAHVGFESTPYRTARLCADLLGRHDNLFMSIRLPRGSPMPSSAMDSGGRLKDEFKRLFTEFPERFVFGSESMYGSRVSRLYANEFVMYQSLLAQLPPEVARNIASENARRIYPLGGGKAVSSVR